MTDGRPAVFLTNRQNVLQIMSAGLIAPRATFAKYYDDLLELTPGAVPLLRTPITADLVAAVSDTEDDASFPVLVEVDNAFLKSHAIEAPDGDVEWSVAAFSGVIPRPALVAIHFRSDRDLEEHSLRDYSNIDAARWTHRVSPDMFAGGTNSAALEWLSARAATAFDLDAYRAADALTGAIAAAAAAVPGDEDLFHAIADLANGAEGSSPAGLLRLSLVDPRSGGEVRGADPGLMRAAAVVLAGADPDDGWSAVSLLNDIEAGVTRAGLSQSATADIGRALAKIRKIVTLQQDFEPFSDKGLDAAKALLLVLLRPDPQRLLEWDDNETGASSAVRVLAATLAGLVRGRTKLPSALRPEALDSMLTRVVSNRLSGSEAGSDSGIVVRRTEKALQLCEGDCVVLERELLPPSLHERLHQLPQDDFRVRRVAHMLADRLDWNDCRIAHVEMSTDTGQIHTAVVDGRIRLEIPGASVRLTVDVPRVLERLRSSSVPPEVETEVRQLLD